MLNENVIRWIFNLERRIEQHLIFEDLEEEHEEKMASLSGKEKSDYELKVLGDFLASEYYNADFDPWPDENTRIDSLEDILKLADNDIEQKRLEISVHQIFKGEEDDEPEVPQMDNQQKDFFNMMNLAYGVNSEYDSMEISQSELLDFLGGELSDPEEENSESDLSVDSRLAEFMNDHMDSF